jgi:hypothetical protein
MLLKFQSADLSPCQFAEAVDNCKRDLTELQVTIGTSTSQAGKFWEEVDEYGAWSVRAKDLCIKLTLKEYGEGKFADVQKFGQLMIDTLLEGIERRFPAEELELLHAFRIFDPQFYKSGTDSASRSQNVEILHVIVKALCSTDFGADRVFTREEWPACRKQFEVLQIDLSRKVQRNPALSQKGFWQEVVSDAGLRVRYGLLLPLVQVGAIISGDSAEVERGFSIHRQIKSAKRNRLSTSTVDMLMRVLFLGRFFGEEMDFNKAGDLFVGKVDDLLTFKLHRVLSAHTLPDPEIDSALWENEEFVFSDEGVEVSHWAEQLLEQADSDDEGACAEVIDPSTLDLSIDGVVLLDHLPTDRTLGNDDDAAFMRDL